MGDHYGMLTVDGKKIKTPSEMEWGLQDVSASNAGRTQNGQMQKLRIAQKRTLKLSWSNPSPEEVSAILKAFNPEYFNVRYFDPMQCGYVTKTFYAGDRTAPFKIWTVRNKRFSSVSFDIIER